MFAFLTECAAKLAFYPIRAKKFCKKNCKNRGKCRTFVLTHSIMKNSRENSERPQRRFCEAKDGPVIRRRYATMRTVELAEMLGLTVKQIENYVYRHNTERWAKKKSSYLSKINSENVKKRWAREKESRNINTNTFFLPKNIP